MSALVATSNSLCCRLATCFWTVVPLRSVWWTIELSSTAALITITAAVTGRKKTTTTNLEEITTTLLWAHSCRHITTLLWHMRGSNQLSLCQYKGNSLKLVTRRDWNKEEKLLYVCILYSTSYNSVGSRHIKELVENMQFQINLWITKTVEIWGWTPTCHTTKYKLWQQNEPKIKEWVLNRGRQAFRK